MDDSIEGAEKIAVMEGLQRSLEDTDRAICMISNFSHRLRSTLTVMRIYTELIQSGACGAVEDDLLDKIGSIESSIDELSEYIDDVQDIGAITNLPPEPYLENNDLYSIVTDVIKGLSSRQSSRLRLEMSRSPLPISAMADRNLSRKCIRHLISFALSNSAPDEQVALRIDKDGDRPIVAITSYVEPIPESEMLSLVDGLTGNVSSLSTQEWKALPLPISIGYCKRMGGSLSIKELDDGRWSYTILFDEGNG
ncbi:MAG: hypothetical protein QCI82_08170 [Candidatus Thermoplasmatota archaeon]|nr:hypothetical protein [Candidatus Thermoplasmatota archaeon]